jgi:hypothetical protein
VIAVKFLGEEVVMHTSPTLKNGMHHFHDSSIKAAHYVGHLFHEKSFWAILAIVTLLIGLFMLVAFFGSGTPMQNYRVPYGPYY